MKNRDDILKEIKEKGRIDALDLKTKLETLQNNQLDMMMAINELFNATETGAK